MTAFDARYYDGRTSGARDVRVRITAAGDVRIEGEGIAKSVRRVDIRVSARLGDSPRYLHLPGGEKCESIDHDAMEVAFADGGGLVHGLERHWPLVLAAAAFTIGFLWLGFNYALPLMARHAAHAIPVTLEIQMGEQSLAALDGHFFEATSLGEADQERAQAAFARVTGSVDTTAPLRLELRRSDLLGANALALPSGIIVVTDQMVGLAQNDQQLMAVLAHEAGHVHHRHIMRSILQNSATAVLLAALIGDISSITGLAASIPTFLVEQHYSREFEFEADRFALDWMRDEGVPARHLADILSRLTEQGGGDASSFERYLSTHPSTQERIETMGR